MSNRYEIYNIEYAEFCEICWLPKLCTTFSSEKWVSSSSALNSITCAVLTQKFSAKYRARNQTKRNRFTKCDKYKVSLKKFRIHDFGFAFNIPYLWPHFRTEKPDTKP